MVSTNNDLNFRLSELTQALNLKSLEEVLSKHWDASCRSYGKNRVFLTEKFIESNNKFFGFPEELLLAYKNTANKINKNKYLKFLFWHIHQILFQYDDAKNAGELLSSWPSLRESLGELSDMFGVTVFTSGIETLQKYYAGRHIPESIMTDTLDDLLRWIGAFHKKNGRFGFNEYPWLYRHFTGRLFRLGRLQFEPAPFADNVTVYKNNTTGEILVYSKPGITYRKDGQINGTGGIFDETDFWTSVFIEKGGKIRGNAITSKGCCSSEITEIAEDRWRMFLDESAMVLNVHIPEGSKLEREQCLQSYAAALAFFREYFSDMNFKAFTCFSWLLDAQLASILPGSSNIVGFQKDYVLFPVYFSGEAQIYERVFGNYSRDENQLPGNTFLQKAIKDYIRAGNSMRNGAGFIPIGS